MANEDYSCTIILPEHVVAYPVSDSIVHRYRASHWLEHGCTVYTPIAAYQPRVAHTPASLDAACEADIERGRELERHYIADWITKHTSPNDPLRRFADNLQRGMMGWR